LELLELQESDGLSLNVSQ